MTTFPAPRQGGVSVQIRQEEPDFSYYPMRRASRRWGLHSILYAADAWGVIEGSLPGQCTTADLTSARSFVRQAREYFTAADRATAPETRPLLYYYGLLNLTKALAMAKQRPGLVGKVLHGISHPYTPGEDVQTAMLKANRTTASAVNVFDELHRAMTNAALPTLDLEMAHLMPQSLVGHRLWLGAMGQRRERFIAVERIRLMHNPTTQELWSVVEVNADLLRRRDRGVQATLTESGLSSTHHVARDRVASGVHYRVFEQTTPTPYTHRSADKVMEVVQIVRPSLWRTISSTPPYRRYYLYLCPPGEPRPLPQLLVTYALMFFLGSLTRYHPDYLLGIFDGRFGAFFREFLATQPQQVLYEFASEFRQQEVTKAAVV